MVDIRAIRERSEKATPGPWHDNAFHGIVTSGGDWNTSDSVSVADIIRRDDGIFIAAARTDRQHHHADDRRHGPQRDDPRHGERFSRSGNGLRAVQAGRE